VVESPFIDRYLALFSEIDRNRASVNIQRLARRICARNSVDMMRHTPCFLFGKEFGEYRQKMLVQSTIIRFTWHSFIFF